MVKNEGDLIEIFVRHNLLFLDALILLDNLSSDGTRAILSHLVREGLPVCVIDDPEIGFAQSEKITNLLHSVTDIFQPDWVVPLDADEFLVPTNNQTLHKILAMTPENHIALIPWKTYIPTSHDNLRETNVLKCIRYRRKIENRQWYKACIPKSLCSDRLLTIHQGSHFVHHPQKQIDYFLPPFLSLAHFPIRTAGQTLGKVFNGWIANLCNPNRIEGEGFHWKALYDKFVSNQSLSSEELYQIALTYASGTPINDVVEDPVSVADIDIHYLHLHQESQLINIVKLAESLADKCSKALQHLTLNNPDPYNASDIINANGGWSRSIHQARLDCDVAPFRYLYERFIPKSVLDIGCGIGTYLHRFKSWGAETVKGVESNDMGDDFLVPEALHIHNLENPLNLGLTFDLVLCVEVIEHVHPQYENIVIDSIARHAQNIIVFSAAQPGQPGIGHINLKPVSYWIDLWQKKGWGVLLFPTLTFRLVSNFIWFKKNTLILVKHNKASAFYENNSFLITDLLNTQDIWKEWPSQRPGTYEHTLVGSRIEESIYEDTLMKQGPSSASIPSSSINIPPLRVLLRHHLPVACRKAAQNRLKRLMEFLHIK